MPRQNSQERRYYEELIDTLEIPIIRRNNGTRYFINPITERSNILNLRNLRRLIELMINGGILPPEIKYDEIDNGDEKSSNENNDNLNENLNEIVEEQKSVETYQSPTMILLNQKLKQKRGKTIRIVIYKNNNIIYDETYKIPTVGYNNFYQTISTTELIIDSNNPLLPVGDYSGEFLNHTYKLDIIEINEIVDGKQINQNFREGSVNHCVLTPILKWAETKFNDSKSSAAKSRYNKKIKVIKELMKKYNRGIPQVDLHSISDLLQIDINVSLPLDIKDPFINCQSTKRKLKTFNFINTRLNHLDINDVVSTNIIDNVSRNKLYELKHNLDIKKKYYMYNKDKRGLSSITTLNGKYIMNNEYYDTIRDFEEDNGFYSFKIDDIDDKKLSSFINNGTHYNGTIDFKDVYPYANQFINTVKHIDMSKAYANFYYCKWYDGFFGKITDFRKTDKIEGNGLYFISNFDFTNCNNDKLVEYNKWMKIYVNNNIYGSPELKMLSSFNVKYTIKGGCWGVKSFDFRFNGDMLNKREDDGIRYYAKWTGGCDQHKLEKNIYMKGSVELFENIKHHTNDGKIKMVGYNEGCLSYKKQHNFHLGHISAQITMYQRMNMIEQLLEFELENIIRICVDGIYYTGETPELKNVFRYKTDKHFGNEPCDMFCSNITLNGLTIPKFEKERDNFSKELHLGAGGTGKTHKVLTDKGLVKVLYVAPSRKLTRCKNKEYGIRTDVLCNLITEDKQKYMFLYNYYNVIVFDEVSMMTDDIKKLIFNRYSNHKLILCGDINYQLPTHIGTPIDTKGFDVIRNHDINYRIKCDELKNVCNLLRKEIKKGNDKNVIKTLTFRKRLNEKVKKFFTEKKRVITVEELKKLYDIKDYILVGTKAVGYEYTKLFTGKFKDQNGSLEEKYYIYSNDGKHSNGDIIYSNNKPNAKCEVRHHFTTHSIQGETIRPPLKIFIDAKTMFESRMFYTAISRAVKLDQIYLIC
jgi:hypothetical protein